MIDSSVFDYSVFHKSEKKDDKIHFRIILYKRRISVSVYKEDSLEDLYIKLYNAIYPEFSSEKTIDVIPVPGLTRVPQLYDVCVTNETDKFIKVPLHRFITVSSFMKSKPEYFVKQSFFGKKFYYIFVIDEDAVAGIMNKNADEKPSYKRFFGCIIR